MGFKVRWKEFDNGIVKILDVDELELVKDSKGTYIKTPIDSIDTCICCGKYCAEGKQICINCESRM